LEKKIEKLREQADINKQEIEQGKTKIDEVISSFPYYYYHHYYYYYYYHRQVWFIPLADKRGECR